VPDSGEKQHNLPGMKVAELRTVGLEHARPGRQQDDLILRQNATPVPGEFIKMGMTLGRMGTVGLNLDVPPACHK
jgi:hypothetical protein